MTLPEQDPPPPVLTDARKEIGIVVWVDDYDDNGNALPRKKGVVSGFDEDYLCVSFPTIESTEWYDLEFVHLTESND